MSVLININFFLLIFFSESGSCSEATTLLVEFQEHFSCSLSLSFLDLSVSFFSSLNQSLRQTLSLSFVSWASRFSSLNQGLIHSLRHGKFSFISLAVYGASWFQVEFFFIQDHLGDPVVLFCVWIYSICMHGFRCSNQNLSAF